MNGYDWLSSPAQEVCGSPSPLSGQNRVSYTLELELRLVVNSLLWVLDLNPGPPPLSPAGPTLQAKTEFLTDPGSQVHTN